MEAYEAVNAGRIRKRRRRTIARESSLLELLREFESLSKDLQIQHLHSHLLNLDKSFLDDSVPDLEVIAVMTEIPSFIGQNYENRDSKRVCTRSKSARLSTISYCL